MPTRTAGLGDSQEQTPFKSEQVIELVDWKFQSMAHRRALAMRGISPERWEGQGGVADLIRRALADRDDEGALMTVCRIFIASARPWEA